MCTAVSYKTKDHYFGRNLDLERGYDERIVITPENYVFSFRYMPSLERHYSMIGMAAVINDYPLYFEATNSEGLSVAGLNFPENSVYNDFCQGKDNITSFELIPYILAKCANIKQARLLIANLNIVSDAFSDDLPTSPLHWIISDKDKSITIESTVNGLNIYDNPFGILTNNPPFDYHTHNINNYMNLNESALENRLGASLELKNYSLGMGALGLPGDFSSASRFIKAVFLREKSVCDKSEEGSVCQFFHILDGVAMPYGCVMTPKGEYEYTRYSSCCNTDKGIYYFKTYNCPVPKSVRLNDYNLNSSKLFEIKFYDRMFILPNP